jgi:hypothetical protein
MTDIDIKGSRLFQASPHSFSTGESSRSASTSQPGTVLPFPGIDTGLGNGSYMKRSSDDDDGMDEGAGGGGEAILGIDGKPKKQKFTRSRTACLQVSSLDLSNT